RELEIWSKINHKNVLPLLGIAHINPDANIPAFISLAVTIGNAKEFILRNPSFPPLHILHDIIQGLHYLHTFEPDPIVHGDIKAVNVLIHSINDRYEACLSDFGLNRFLVDSTLWRTPAIRAGSLPWMSPELMTGNEYTPTKESDVYAYGMTCYEILSGDVPFKSVTDEFAFSYKVDIMGQRPERVKSTDLDCIWDIITQCWAEKEEDRPHTAEVLELVRTRTPPYDPSLFKIGQRQSSAHATVTKSDYHTASTGPLAESDETTVLTKSTNRRYLNVSETLETEDERMVEGGLIEPTSRSYLNVRKF
ncbi:hypothetical protein M378DRAFT_18124, partial [Amanita muscaria Koide BX008]